MPLNLDCYCLHFNLINDLNLAFSRYMVCSMFLDIVHIFFFKKKTRYSVLALFVLKYSVFSFNLL
jgi:hypothetical protein